MSRTDYVIVHNTNVNLENLLKDKLKEAVENSYGNIVEDEVFSNALRIRYTKNFSDNAERSLSGFSINLDIFIGESNTQEIVASFSDIISTAQDDGIFHIIKFYDDKLHQDNAKLAEELFEVEMKLREVFSVIFIDTEEDNFYKLIKDTSVIPLGDPQLSQMQSRYENEFFYLTFSQYKSLNEKKAITNVPQIIQLIRSSTDFQVFQENFLHLPIQKEEYADFILSLKSVLEPIETVRNCVMHNRVVSERDKNNYVQAKEELDELINDFLSGLPKN